MLRKLMIGAAAIAFVAAPAAAQEVEATATAAEVEGVTATLAMVGCEVGEATVEKENDNLFEIDDAQCGTGQFDIKLDAEFNIVALTNDGPIDPAATPVEATEAEVAGVTEALAAIGCEVGESPVERETADMFEIDDAQCEIGQYDIKLDAAFAIISMTRD
ncbi:MAG: hypothetical protein AB7O56_07685 [Bauldia sp.]